jgi:hypothetical protein
MTCTETGVTRCGHGEGYLKYGQFDVHPEGHAARTGRPSCERLAGRDDIASYQKKTRHERCKGTPALGRFQGFCPTDFYGRK